MIEQLPFRKWEKFILISELVLLLGVFLVFTLLSVQGYQIYHNNPLNLSDYELVWGDEFDGTSLDTSKWKINNMESDQGLRRAAKYSSNAVIVQDGNLILRTTYNDQGPFPGWQTGWVESSKVAAGVTGEANYEGFNAKYGYFEMRGIAPKSVGIWSAFWMMPDDNIAFTAQDTPNTATDGCEIDIMESPYLYLGNFAGNKVTHVLHSDYYGEEVGLKSSHSATYYLKKMYSEYHTYGVEWTPEYMAFYLDGYLTWKTDYTYYDTKLQKNIAMSVPQVAEYLILSVEVAGTNDQKELKPGYLQDGTPFWCGNPEVNKKDQNYDFIIDYVHVYQKKVA